MSDAPNTAQLPGNILGDLSDVVGELKASA